MHELNGKKLNHRTFYWKIIVYGDIFWICVPVSFDSMNTKTVILKYNHSRNQSCQTKPYVWLLEVASVAL